MPICWGWETIVRKGETLGFLWWTCTCLQEQLYIVWNFMPKRFPLGRNFMPKHFPHIQKIIYHEGIYPLGYDAAHLRHPSTADGSSFSLGANNPLSITRVQISTSPRLPRPSPPLPLQMTVIKSFIHQSCLRYSNCSITRAEGCSVRQAVLLGVGSSVPHHCAWMSVCSPTLWPECTRFAFFCWQRNQVKSAGTDSFERERRERARDGLTHIWSSQSRCTGWWRGSNCQAACPAPSWVRGCGGKKQTLLLPPCYPQGLNIFQKWAGGSFCSSVGKISEFTVADCERFLDLFLGTFHKTTECKLLSLGHVHAGANTPPDVNHHFSNKRDSLYPQLFTHK